MRIVGIFIGVGIVHTALYAVYFLSVLYPDNYSYNFSKAFLQIDIVTHGLFGMVIPIFIGMFFKRRFEQKNIWLLAIIVVISWEIFEKVVVWLIPTGIWINGSDSVPEITKDIVAGISGVALYFKFVSPTPSVIHKKPHLFRSI